MGHLQLAWLGVPQVRHGGETLRFPTRKALALLVYLSSEGGVQSREKLTALLWPDSDERRGRALLRRTLAFVRAALQDASGAAAPHLDADRESLAFAPAADAECDVLRLARTAAMPAAGLAALREAAGAVRGDFLEGFSLGDAPGFDDWASQQREYWQRCARGVCERLVRALTEAGAYAEAIEALARWLRFDPYNEDAYLRLMRLHSAQGDRAAALQAYAACEAMLAREFRARPAAELKALAARIRAEATPQAGPEREQPSLPPPALTLPFVGRHAEAESLRGSLRRAQAGRAQVVAIEGVAGSGKSRLAAEFLSRAAAGGARVWTGRAFEAGGRIPYQPMVELLRTGLSGEPQAQNLLSPVWLAELSRLLPELRDALPLPAAAALQPETAAQARLLEAVVRLGQAVAARGPLVLSLDDVQWSDAATLDLLLFAQRRWQALQTRVLCLLTVRAESLATEPPLAAWFAALARETSLTHVSLDVLAPAEIETLVRALVPAESPERSAFSRWLQTETGGQPFYIAETLNVLRERGTLAQVPNRPGASGRWTLDLAAAGTDQLSGMVPPGVREMIRGQFARLSPGAAALAAAGAVLGRDLEFGLLCEVAGSGELDGLAALDALQAAHWFQPGTLPMRYRFAHDKLRDVVYTEAGETRRRVLHRRALDCLSRAGAPAAELAQHAIAAGLPAEAFRHSLAAGDDAMRMLAMRDALAHYEQARPYLDAAGSAEARLHWAEQLGRACEFDNRNEEARALYQRMLAEARAERLPVYECAALNRLANLIAEIDGDFRESMRLLYEASAVAEQAADRLGWAETEWSLAHNEFYAGVLDSARAHAERALALAGGLAQPALVARSREVLAYIHAALLEWDACEAFAQEARAGFATLADTVSEANCMHLTATAQLNSGRASQGTHTARAAYELSRGVESLRGQAMSALNWAHGLRETGDLAQALSVADDGLALARTIGDIPNLVFILVELGGICRAMGDTDRAYASHLEAQQLNKVFPAELFTQTVMDELCADRVAAADWEKALAHAREACAARDLGATPFGGLIPWYRVEGLLHAGKLDEAAVECGRVAAIAAARPRYRIGYLRALSAVARAQGDTAQALVHLQAAAALAADMGLRVEHSQIEAALALIQRRDM